MKTVIPCVLPALLCLVVLFLSACESGEFVGERPGGVEVRNTDGVDTARTAAFGVASGDSVSWSKPGPLERQWLRKNGFAYAGGRAERAGRADSLLAWADSLASLKRSGAAAASIDSLRSAFAAAAETTSGAGSPAVRGRRTYVRQSR